VQGRKRLQLGQALTVRLSDSDSIGVPAAQSHTRNNFQHAPLVREYAIRSAEWLEAEMTSDIGVERAIQQKFLFHCSCGAPIETSEEKETCRDCGKTIEVVSCVPTPEGKKYSLRISRRGNKESYLRPTGPIPRPAVSGSDRRHRTGHRLESPSYNERFLGLGVLTLLSPFYLPLFVAFFLCIAPVTVDQERPHHYERHDIHVRDGRGGIHTIPTWKRVDD
jgi:hypothetical protein